MTVARNRIRFLMAANDGEVPPILAQKYHAQPSAFDAFDEFSVPVLTGATWTTDAPFREMQAAIDAMARRNLMAVEMEAAALYAFAQARQKPVLCFADVANQMGRVDCDFERGEAEGSRDALELIARGADRLRSRGLP
jgi:purine-nucleoside phosphorylase